MLSADIHKGSSIKFFLQKNQDKKMVSWFEIDQNVLPFIIGQPKYSTFSELLMILDVGFL